MPLTMADSITAANLPGGFDAYLGYVDGAWPDFEAEVAQFPGKHIIGLTVFPGVVADGADCENGDLTIAQEAAWIRWRVDAGEWRPIAYAAAYNVQAVIDAIAALGITRAQYRILSAHTEWQGPGGQGPTHICGPGTCGYPQADGTQWTFTYPGRNSSQIDVSELADDFFGGPVLTKKDIAEVAAAAAAAVWNAEAIPAPVPDPAHPHWAAERVLSLAAAQGAAAEKLLAALTPAAIAAAVVAALPPAATGGLTQQQVEQAGQAVAAQIGAALQSAFSPTPPATPGG